MGLMDRFHHIKKKGRDLAEKHSDKIDKAMEKGKDLANKRTSGRYSEQIDKGARKIRDQFKK